MMFPTAREHFIALKFPIMISLHGVIYLFPGSKALIYRCVKSEFPIVIFCTGFYIIFPNIFLLFKPRISTGHLHFFYIFCMCHCRKYTPFTDLDMS